MSEFSQENWQRIKILANRLQAIKSMLEVFNEQAENQPPETDLNAVKEQLEADFDRTLADLLELIDDDS
jgi:hypothetical protein